MDRALGSLLDPVIIFFVLGVAIGFLRSNLEIPQALAKFFSLYLLVSLGFKGGSELAHGGLPAAGALALLVALLMAAAVPLYSFAILRFRRCDPFEAAAIAGTYGSVSAVTFITAQQFLIREGTEFGGYMAVALVLMESPAVIMAVLLSTFVRNKQRQAAIVNAENGSGPGVARDDTDDAADALPSPLSLKKVMHEALTDGSSLLLLGSLLTGFISSDKAREAMVPFTDGIFKGILAFFLLELGLLVARQMLASQARLRPFLIGFALTMPMVNASIALGLSLLLGLDRGDALMVMVLAASASYIVVPAVARYAIPEASPGVYLTMALGITFPFNILIGIPLYYAATGVVL